MYWKRILIYLFLLASVHAQEPLSTRMTCQAVKFLPAEEAVQRPEVELEGIVTCVPSGWKGFFVSDSTGGVYCEPFDTESESTFWPITVGEKVVLRGEISEGNLNSFVLAKRVLSREPSILPLPASLTLEKVVREVHDADYISVRGIMVRPINIAGEMEYGLVAEGVECDVAHAGFRIDPKLPIHTEVEISGVVIPIQGKVPFKIVVPKKECFRVLQSQEQLYSNSPLDSVESIIGNRKDGELVRFRADLFRVSEKKAWLTNKGFGIEWSGTLDASQMKDLSWEFAGIKRSMDNRVFIEHGNVVANVQELEKKTIPVKIDYEAQENILNRVVTTQGFLIDRHTIEGTTYLEFENRQGRWTANINKLNAGEGATALVFGATYAITGLVTSSTQGSQEKHIVLADQSDIQFLSAPPLSMRHKLAFSIAITSLMAIGLCASMVAFQHLTKVKKRLERAQTELRIANESLESRIDERTQELQCLNQALTIAERKAKEANEAKSSFLANMSHEIRTPMTAILGFTEILRDASDLTDSQRQAFLDTINRNGDHLLSVIDEILDLAKIESGKFSIQFEKTNPATLVREVISLLQVKAIAKSLEIEAVISQDAPTWIWTDPTRLRQVLLNLIGNAIKFTEVGKVSVKLSLEASSADKVRIEVVDSGIGIGDEHMPRLFDAFEQSDNSSTRVYGGTGLGLSITKNLVSMLGGEISVRSKLGVGSCFCIVLPIGSAQIQGHQITNITPDLRADFDLGDLQGVRILFAEDGVDNQKLIAFHLKRAGAKVHLVEDGLQMVEAMCGELGGELIFPCPYDLIVTDMQMPVMDGYTAVEMLRSQGCNLPIIALTAHAMNEDSDKCIRAGCDLYLTKPIDRTILLATCAKMLQRNGMKSK